MTTATSPSSVRDQATAVIAARLGGFSSCLRRLEDLGDGVAADILIALEARFGVDLDPVPGLTLGALADLVEARAAEAGRILHWDDERTKRGLPLGRVGSGARSATTAAQANMPEVDRPQAETEQTAFDLRSGDCRLCGNPGFLNQDLRCLACFCGPEEAPPAHAVRGPAVSPAPDAWDRAERLWARERTTNALLALAAAVAFAGQIAGWVFWAQAAGLIR